MDINLSTRTEAVKRSGLQTRWLSLRQFESDRVFQQGDEMAYLAGSEKESLIKAKIRTMEVLLMASNNDLTTRIWYPSNLITGVYTLEICHKGTTVYVLFRAGGEGDPDNFQVVEYFPGDGAPFNRMVGQHYDMFSTIHQVAHFLGLFVHQPM